MRNARVFVTGDAAHRHPPSNGLGSNTSIQDAFNLAWKLAALLGGQATPKLPDRYSAERAPIATQIVTRANKSIPEFGPIFEALGMDGNFDHARIEANMGARCNDGPAAEAQREALRAAIAYKKNEFDRHGVVMNQRYISDAVVTDGQPEPAPNSDMELHCQPTTWPGARLPHAWVFDRPGRRLSTPDLCGKGRFTLITGSGGAPWVAAAQAAGARLGRAIRGALIGPRHDIEDHTGDWARMRECGDAGCLPVRPGATSRAHSVPMNASPAPMAADNACLFRGQCQRRVIRTKRCQSRRPCRHDHAVKPRTQMPCCLDSTGQTADVLRPHHLGLDRVDHQNSTSAAMSGDSVHAGAAFNTVLLPRALAPRAAAMFSASAPRFAA